LVLSENYLVSNIFRPPSCKSLKKAVREQGYGAVIHGNSGRHPANVTGEAIRAKIIALKKSGAYQKANFTHFRELL
jgi:hypothetical protein